MSPSRPKKPADPRPIVEGARKAIHDPDAGLGPSAERVRHAVVDPPPDRFSDGVRAQQQLRRMCPESEAGCDLGPYIESDVRGDDGLDLGGPAQKINFPPFWHRWFSKQTTIRLATIDELVDERIERRVLRNFFRRLKHAAIVTFVSSAIAAHWFSDQIAWLMERMPVLKAFWTLVTGARS